MLVHDSNKRTRDGAIMIRFHALLRYRIPIGYPSDLIGQAPSRAE